MRPLAAQMTAKSRTALERKAHDVDGGPSIADRPPVTAENFERVRQRLSEVAQRYGDRKYLSGDQLTYADFAVVVRLLTLDALITEEEKKQVLTGDGGRWTKLLEEFETAGYLTTDEGEIYAPKA
jgi:glutathione S-transferase